MPALERFKKEINSKYGLRFGFLASLPFLMASEEINMIALNCNHEGRIDTDEAVIKLKSQLRLHGDKSKLRPVEKGEPIFLLSKTEGKTKPLLTLWDSGCGSVLFEDGVPTKELGPAVLKTPGPIFIHRVRDTTCKATG